MKNLLDLRKTVYQRVLRLRYIIVPALILLNPTLIAANPNISTTLSPTEPWILNPTTAHYYKLLTDCSGWHSCEDAAIAQDAHLVTINDADEQAWLVTTFGSAEYFWIGFTDENNEGNWYWISGESNTYTNWAPGEPSNSGGAEHYALMNWVNPGLWNDGHEAAITKGIIERVSPPYSTSVVLHF